MVTGQDSADKACSAEDNNKKNRFQNNLRISPPSFLCTSHSAPPSPSARQSDVVLTGMSLTPRSFHMHRARPSFPPLQPLSISRKVDEWPMPSYDDIGVWSSPPTPGATAPVKHLETNEKVKIELCTNLLPPKIEEGSGGGIDLKRDKMSFFEKDCSRVAEYIYLGSDMVAQNREVLRKHGITHVLNCVGFVCPEYFKTDLVYKTLWLQDSPCEDITSILYDVFDYFEEVREQGGKVLVHCYQGVSRSTALVIGYLMWRKGQSFEEAFQYVKAARGITKPNAGFADQLQQCQKRVHDVPLSPGSLLRMFRMAPHSSYDALHLVPKVIEKPSYKALDSRGAFIVQVPNAIYVWIGEKCEHTMCVAAKASAFQVARYERIQVPIVTVGEGEDKENSQFWEALSRFSALEEVPEDFRLDVGDKRVDCYDIDFELYRRASTGGIVPPVPLSSAGSETRLPTRENGWGFLRRKFVTGNIKEIISQEHCSKVDDANVLSLDPLTSSPSSLSSPSSVSSGSDSLSPSSFSLSAR